MVPLSHPQGGGARGGCVVTISPTHSLTHSSDLNIDKILQLEDWANTIVKATPTANNQNNTRQAYE